MHDEDSTESEASAAEPRFGGEFVARELGSIFLTWTERGLCSIDLPSAPRRKDDLVEASIPARFQEPLDRYFAGEKIDFRPIPIDVRGTSFQRRVWDALRTIPHGAVRTYAAVATMVGSPRGMRAVGMANAKNPIPIIVPCHRVIEAGSHLGGYSGGLDTKRFLLQLEGVKLKGDVVLPGQLDLIR